MRETSPHFVRKKLIKDEGAYVDSVGRDDMETLGRAMDIADGTGTVLRLIMGASSRLPLRSVTYVDSILRIAKVLPHEQIQIVHAVELGCKINPIKNGAALEQAELLASVTRLHARASFEGLLPGILHAVDSDVELEPFQRCAEAVVSDNPKVLEQLSKKGSKHGGDAVQYAAAHSAYQDTDLLRLRPLMDDSPEQAVAERIISVGCDQERLFYGIRMLMRKAISPDIELVDTAQIFTKHVVPPYFEARSGEQMLDHALVNGVDLALAIDFAAARDIEHFKIHLGDSNG